MDCWIVTDGKAGMENQCLGLAEALGVDPVVKRVRLRAPWRQFLPWLRIGLRHAASPGGDSVAPPWPGLLISCGRQGIGPALLARRASGGRTLTVHIQDPQIAPGHFDLVTVPVHDRLRGPNVFVTEGSLSRVTPERLRAAAERHAASLAALPRPRMAVLIGGSSAAYRMTPAVAQDLASRLRRMAEDGVGLMVTASRRTGEANAALLRSALDHPNVAFWDGQGDNPYFAYLALADAVAVTADSVNMVSDAATTGKPVHIIELEGGAPKFAAFHRRLYDQGIARPFQGRVESWTYAPWNDSATLAAEVRRRVAARPA